MRKIIYTLLLGTYLLSSCESFLDVKPRSNIIIPQTLEDMEQLLDNGTVVTPYSDMLELQTDDYYLEESYWSGMFNQVNKNAYVWEKDVFGTEESHESWSIPYHKIFYTNAVLDGLATIERTAANSAQYDQIKGSALFLKAEAVYLLAQLFANVYDPQSAEQDLGVPIPMSADVNEQVSRPSMQYTFDFITSTLAEAEKLLMDQVDYSRPSKAAANALLARVYLYMGVYDQALLHADASLDVFDDLIDLNKQTLRDYRQTLLFRIISPTNQIRNASPSTFVDETLINSYEATDKRLTAFYTVNGGKRVKRNTHSLALQCFGGFDADEQYFIRAECRARDGQVELALEDLNTVLKKRFTTDNYVPYSDLDADEALALILKERRKELVFRGLRWSDLKRFNRDGGNYTLVRKLGSVTYTLPPNDRRWVLPIPANEIKTSQIEQNER